MAILRPFGDHSTGTRPGGPRDNPTWAGRREPDLDLAAEDYVGTQYLRVATVLAPSRGEIDCADSTTIMQVGPIKSPDSPGIIVLTFDLERAMGDSAETAKLGYFRVATIEWPGGELVTPASTPTPAGS